MTKELLYELIKREIEKGVDFFNVVTIKEAIGYYSVKTDIQEDNIQSVIEYLEVNFNCVHMMANRTRTPELVYARYCLFWFLVSKKKWTLTRVSRDYKYNHATVLRAVNLINDVHRTHEYYNQISAFKNLFI